MRVAVTGHRPQHLSLEDGYWIQDEFARLIQKVQPTIGISGMALGADTWWATEILHAKIPLHAYVPFPSQHEKWRFDDKNYYWQLLEQATYVKTICPEFSMAAYDIRNRAMVDNCDLLIAAWNGKRNGGTYNAVQYAEANEVDIVYVDPGQRTTTRKKR